MNLISTSHLLMKYLSLPNAIGGRGGVERFFMLSHQIPFQEQLYPSDDWKNEKLRLIESAENPCGKVPLLYYQNEDSSQTPLPLSQHIATCRYLARIHGITSDDSDGHYQEYIQDLVADEYQGFRNAWSAHAFADQEIRTQYSTDELPTQLFKFETLYRNFQTHDVFLSVSRKTGQPLWGDAALFGLLRDHIRTGLMTRSDLEAYERLSALFTAYRAIPAIGAWCDAKENEVKDEP